MEKFNKMIKKYLKKDDPELLHDIRVFTRRKLSSLEKEGLIDKGLKKLLKKSSKLRDTDVLLEICKSKKIKKYLKNKKKKQRKKFIKSLKNFKSEITPLEKKKIDIEKCKEVLNEPFLGKSDDELHKIRVVVKKCRYAYDMPLKKIQDYLGEAHDYYNCEKLMLKFGKNPKKAIKKKLKFIKKAEKERLKLNS
ncbi:CHAD domain-containing protein [Caminibacter sp.]